MDSWEKNTLRYCFFVIKNKRKMKKFENFEFIFFDFSKILIFLPKNFSDFYNGVSIIGRSWQKIKKIRGEMKIFFIFLLWFFPFWKNIFLILFFTMSIRKFPKIPKITLRKSHEQVKDTKTWNVRVLENFTEFCIHVIYNFP